MTRTVTWERLTNHTSRVVISEPPTADDVRSQFASLGLAGSALEREALGQVAQAAWPYGWWNAGGLA
jgi:hypothetical protein